jgi:hypothetical protein
MISLTNENPEKENRGLMGQAEVNIRALIA